MKNQKLLIVGMIAIIVISIAFTVVVIVRHNNKPEPTYDDVISTDALFGTTTVGGLTIKDGYITADGGISTYGALAVNNTSSDINVGKLYIEVTLNNNVLKNTALSDVTIKAGQSFPIMITFDRDISAVSKINFVLE